MLENINITDNYIAIRHIGVYVSNLEIMKQFYINTFDMHVICNNYLDKGEFIDMLYGKSNTDMYITKLITPHGKISGVGDMLELIYINDKRKNRENATKLTDIGRMHIAFETWDIHETIQKVLKNKGKILVKPFCRENGNWLAFCCDPENNYLELIQRQ